MFFVHGINKYNNKCYIDFSFLNLEVDKTMNIFKDKLEEINSYICELVNKKFNDLIFINSIKCSYNNYPEKMRCSINDRILVFDENKKLLNFDYIQSKIYCKFLIYISSVWKNKTHTFGIKYEIAQVKLYPKTILNTYSFIDDNVQKNCSTDNDIYKKYFKMLSCGVPKQAVKNKMMMDNLDPNIL